MEGHDSDGGARGGAAGDLRTAFIRAAREILDEPDTGLDLRKVAERAGKSRTAPYLVFGKTDEGGGLEALRVAVAASGTQDLVREIELVLKATLDPEAAVHRLAVAYVDFARRHPRLFRLMFGPEVARAMQVSAAGRPSREEVSDLVGARAELEKQFRAVVEGGRAVGAIAPGDTWPLVVGAWSMLHGAAMLLLDGQLGAAGVGSDSNEAAALATRFLMDDAASTVAAAAVTLAESQAEKGLASPELDRALRKRRSRLMQDRPTEAPAPAPIPTPRETAPPYGIGRAAWDEAGNLDFARVVLAGSTALRRARRMRSVLQGSRLLWIDDNPERSRLEQDTLEHLGAEVVRVQDTSEALEFLAARSPARNERGGGRFDVILSDIARPGAPGAGIEALPMIRKLVPETPVIFYVGRFNADAGIPRGAFGITNDPGELLHLILDALERRRV